MEELSRIAMAYYQASSGEVQRLALEFFGAMDNDGDRKIDQKEFLEFMRDQGYTQMTNPSFFNQLDLDGNGTLDFFEVMTLYYIVMSERPFCDCCKNFITSTYLSCVGCLEDPTGGSFYLCLDCYKWKKCDHTHNDLSRFLDNYALLEAMKKSKLNELRSAEVRSGPFGTVPVDNPSSRTYNRIWNPSSAIGQVPYTPAPIQNHHLWNPSAPPAPLQNVAPAVHDHTWIQNSYSYHHQQPPHHFQYRVASNAIVRPRQHWEMAKIALETLSVAITASAVGGSLCSIL